MLATANVWGKIAEMLLTKGAEIDAQDLFGRTALHWVAFWNREEMVKELLRRGANASLADKEGNTPAEVAALRGNKSVQDIFQG